MHAVLPVYQLPLIFPGIKYQSFIRTNISSEQTPKSLSSLISNEKKHKMRAKAQSAIINLKIILISCFFVFLLFLILRSTFSYSQQKYSSVPIIIHPTNLSHEEEPNKQSSTTSDDCPTLPNYLSTTTTPLVPTCTKISPSLAHALVHYATLNITPQQTLKEISVSLTVLEKKSPCNFLVFGLGHDSLMWTSLNHGGRTVFLEEDKSWIEHIQGQIPSLESYHVVYESKVTEADELLEMGMMQEECKVVSDPRFSKCKLALKGLPSEVYDIEWDVIMVDAPTGYFDGAPGRMSAIYTAGLMARNRENGESDVFVHDVNRAVEDRFSKAFLCEGYLRQEEGRLRHFTIPSHRTRLGRPFCP